MFLHDFPLSLSTFYFHFPVFRANFLFSTFYFPNFFGKTKLTFQKPEKWESHQNISIFFLFEQLFAAWNLCMQKKRNSTFWNFFHAKNIFLIYHLNLFGQSGDIFLHSFFLELHFRRRKIDACNFADAANFGALKYGDLCEKKFGHFADD